MIGKKWFDNQMARNKAKKAGEPRPLTGGFGDKLAAKVDEKKVASEKRLAAATAANEAHKAEKAAKKAG